MGCAPLGSLLNFFSHPHQKTMKNRITAAMITAPKTLARGEGCRSMSCFWGISRGLGRGRQTVINPISTVTHANVAAMRIKKWTELNCQWKNP